MSRAVEWREINRYKEYAGKITSLACWCQLPRYFLKTELITWKKGKTYTGLHKCQKATERYMVKHSAYAVATMPPSQPTKPDPASPPSHTAS